MRCHSVRESYSPDSRFFQDAFVATSKANEFFAVLWTLEFRVLTDESDYLDFVEIHGF